MTRSINPGDFFILGFEGTTPRREFIGLLESCSPAGIILLGWNYRKFDRLKKLVAELRSIIGNKAIIAVDQEPGRVQRFKAGFPQSMLPEEYVKAEAFESFAEWCTNTACLLREAGINLNLSPVVDLMPFTAGNGVLTGRSFGDDFEMVNRFSKILIDRHQKEGVMTCAKHFPGLGSAATDPHLVLSRSSEPFASFRDYHWKPFQAAVESRVSLVMTTHLLAKSLDRGNQATYSRKITGHLREDMKFLGPVISDDLIMAGAGIPGNIGQSALRSLAAGHDLVIISKDVTLQKKAIEDVGQAIKRDEGFRAKLKESAERLERVKTKIRNR